MNEFLKLSWRLKDLTKIDDQRCFLTEEAAADSYVYKSFTKPLKAQTKKKVKLNFAKEKYIPGKKYYRAIHRRSLLRKSEKSHCLTALKLIQSGKGMELMTASEKCSIQVYQECQPKIFAENQNFLQYIQNIWNKNKDKPLRIKPGILNYSWYHWKRNIERYLKYPQFYKDTSSICLNYDENESTVSYKHVLNSLEMGTLARFAPPNLKEPYCLKLVTLPKLEEEISLNSKLPVSQDQNIIKLLETHQFNAVISSSGLKQIIDYTNTKIKWIIPVVIKDISINDIKKKVVFIDKVLPKVNPSYQDLKYYAYKQLLKSNLCQYKAFSFPTEETPVENSTGNRENSEKAPDENLEKTDEAQKGQSKQRLIHHNVSYKIWSVQKTDNQNTLMKSKAKDKEIKLLIRCKLDACELTEQGALYPVIIKPKIEQQLQYGANIATKSELAREWASLFFRVYSNLYRARIFSPMSEVISVEKCSVQKINTEALSHYNYKPILGLGVLQKVVEELTNLECGNYLLLHLPKNESFVSVLKQTNESDANYNLHAECEESKIDSEAKQAWLPVDVNYILPVHEENGQIPGTFQGFDNYKHDLQVKKKKKGVKNKKKAKGRIGGENDDPPV